MKIRTWGLFVMAVCAMACSQAWGAISLATWNFNASGGSQNGAAYAGTTPYTANSYNTSWLGASTGAQMTSVTSSLLGSQGAGAGDSGGTSLKFTSANLSFLSVNQASFTLTLKMSTTPYTLTSLTITYNCLSSLSDSGVVNAWTLAGASAGNATVDAVITKDGAGHWDSATVTFTGIKIASGNTITLKDALSGYASGALSYAEFDNIGVTAVPEPVAKAMAIFGLVFGGSAVGQFYLRQKKRV